MVIRPGCSSNANDGRTSPLRQSGNVMDVLIDLS
jgi:hypothetical protein